ncbi:MAG: translation initiation factor IF-3 [Alphaproteobacteria bacterium]|nr:MAG: translation initiation factor IF-3 [Alphaproteobacteria bacterium]
MAYPTTNKGPQQQSGPRVNEQIRSAEVRLIDAEGEMLGVVTLEDALARASDAGLDLLEVSPNAAPPVCKLIDYGKYRYEQQKKANIARKKQKIIQLKELKMRPTIEEHDYQVKMKAARKFLEAGDKVKFTMRFRGREVAHQEVGMEVFNRIKDELEGLIKIESHARMEGRQMIMIVAPDTAAPA